MLPPPPSARATTEQIAALLDAAAGLWSEPSPLERNGAHAGYRQVLVVAGGVVRISEAVPLLAPFMPVREAWLSWIEPGGLVVEHIDAGPHFERWQVQLSDCGALIQRGERCRPGVGEAFRVQHDDWHAVENNDPGPRVVLVVDRDVLVSATKSPFVRR